MAPKTRSDLATGHHVILEVEFTGGFVKGVKLVFADGLNCIIGGRGTGKTTILELIRYALGLDRGMRARSKAAIQALLGSGRVRIRVRTRGGLEYVAERAANEAPRVLDEKGVVKAVSFDTGALFTAEVYGQNEIEEIAVDPTRQLELLDKFVEEEVLGLGRELERVQGELAQNASELVRLDRDIDRLAETAGGVVGVEERLAALKADDGPDAEKLDAAHVAHALRDKERATVTAADEELRRLGREIDQLAVSALRRLGGIVDDDVARGPNRKFFSQLSAGLERMSDTLESSSRKVADAVNQTTTARSRSSGRPSRSPTASRRRTIACCSSARKRKAARRSSAASSRSACSMRPAPRASSRIERRSGAFSPTSAPRRSSG